jgi:polyisoprenoid-binding protein YceI
MKKLCIFSAIGISALLFSFKTIVPATWAVDKMHSKIGFSITHNMASDVEGSFRSFDATITTKGDDFAGANIDLTADAASITTDNVPRDKHIKTADFLYVVQFPKVTFKSTSVTKKSAATYRIAGELTLHGITKPVVLNAFVRIPPAAVGLTTDLVLGDEITISANGEFAKN